MSAPVKRRYDSSRRQAATRATKRAVIDAAGELFVEQGYPATTVSQIADRSGIPEATVYRLFGGKLAILKDVLDVAFGGDDEPIEYQRRPEVQAALNQADAGALLDAFAHLAGELLHRSAALQLVLLTSAAVDAGAAEMLEVTRSQRRVGQARIVKAIARGGHLRPGLTPAVATDIVYALMAPELFRILTVERRWSETRYEQWLAATLRAQLLPS